MKFRSFFCTYIMRLPQIALLGFLVFWAVEAFSRGSKWEGALFTFASLANIFSFLSDFRRDAVQYVFRHAQQCTACNTKGVIVLLVTPFRFFNHAQCAITFCPSCDYVEVYSCKCSPNRCEHRIECLAWSVHKIPLFYSKISLTED